MAMVILKVENITHRYFCNDTSVKRGSIVGRDNDNVHALLGNRCIEQNILGIALQNVVTMNITDMCVLTNPAIAQTGGKIEILTKGVVTINLPYKLKLPFKQPIYVQQEDAMLGWRKLGREVGHVVEHKQNGHCIIKVDFT